MDSLLPRGDDMRQTAEQIEDEAAGWIVRIDREGRTWALETELEEWLAGDVRRSGALLQAEAAWALLDDLEGSASAAQHSVVPLRPTKVSRRALTLWASLGVGLAAASAGIAVLGRSERYDTGVGEIRRVPLRDGSTVALNTNTEIAVSLGQRRRDVRLMRGEAWFHVAKDATRPFQVTIGNARVQAVGTAFSVRADAGGVEIIVTEGIVRAWINGAEAKAVHLSAGARAVVVDTAEVFQTDDNAVETEGRLAWMAGKLDFRGETLEQAVTEFNRYNTRKLVVVDPALARQKIHGVFRADDPAAFARALEVTLDAKVSYSSTQILIGTRRR